jgi:putative CocE/NonD family hydrolase
VDDPGDEAERLRPASPARHRVAALRDVRIPVSDGLELSANLWLPEPLPDGSEPSAFPAILEMIPYRKDDWRAASDESLGEWLAARGYAFCRLDVRGTGSSPGIALDEYTGRETQDGAEAVEWLARQPWCSGRVGMWGISYGGFTAIQVAMLRPPHLAAIVPMMATDDRYTDDVHYLGGCATVSELSQYAVSMVGMNALPAKTAQGADGWEEEWRDRLERTPVWLFEWLRQQHDGPSWRAGSLAPEWERLATPCFLIGGWMDEYVDAALRMLERCTNAPRRALIGNWVHDLPDDAYPGPNVDWRHEMIRFFDHWLKGVDNGVMEEPELVAFRHSWAKPERFPTTWPGAWIAEPAWPVPDLGKIELALAPGEVPLVGRLGAGDGDRAAEPGVERLVHRATAGARGGSLCWGAGSPPNGLAGDLRSENALVPTFTSDALDADVDILGRPEVVLSWESPVAVATAVVRLQDVAPDGTPFQVSAGVLNLTHRTSHARPEPLPIGQPVEVRIRMRSTAHRFARSHRIRLSVASAFWPVIWPSPLPAVHRLHVGGGSAARLVLPTLPAGHVGGTVPPFKTSRSGLREIGRYRGDPPIWEVVEDALDESLTVRTSESGESLLPDGTSTLYTGERLEMTARDADPSRAEMRNEVVYRLQEAGRPEILVEVNGTTRTTETEFRMNVGLAVTVDGAAFFERTWEERIPRRLV